MASNEYIRFIFNSASHNPKDDNGYKVYWENAIQVALV